MFPISSIFMDDVGFKPIEWNESTKIIHHPFLSWMNEWCIKLITMDESYPIGGWISYLYYVQMQQH
jgi:hypothetical protein